MAENELKGHLVDASRLPPLFPTSRHSAAFWEALGRTVGTFGFLEEALGKAIFAFTGTRTYPEELVQAAFEKWLPTLKGALSDPLGRLIDRYGSAVRSHGEANISNFDELLEDLRNASRLRNVLCHGSWRVPGEQGRSLPLYVDKQGEIFEDYVDLAYLEKVREDVVKLICAIINTVTHMGWQFPGSNGPGRPIW